MKWDALSESEFFERLCDALEGRRGAKEALLLWMKQHEDLPPRYASVLKALQSKSRGTPRREKGVRSAQIRVLYNVLMAGVGQITFTENLECNELFLEAGDNYRSTDVTLIVGSIMGVSKSSVEKNKVRSVENQSRFAVEAYGLRHIKKISGPASDKQIRDQAELFLKVNGECVLPVRYDDILNTPLLEYIFDPYIV